MAAQKNFEEAVEGRFNLIVKPEISFKEFLELERRQAASMTTCGNGDLDSTLDGGQWVGAPGDVFHSNDPNQPFPNEPNLSTMIAGLLSDSNIFSPNGYQTWGSTGVDPIVPIPTTAQGSPGAVRVGNAVDGFGSEILTKTFTVTGAKALIKFWYAVVLQNPSDHPIEDHPFFWVRVTDANGF